MNDGTGEAAISDLETGAEYVFYTQVTRSRQDLVGRCRADDRDRVALLQVRLDQGAGFRVDLLGNVGPEDFVAELGVGFFADAPEKLRCGQHQGRVAEYSQPETYQDADKLDKVARRHVTAFQLFLEERADRVAGDNCAVKIEKCTNLRSVRELFNLCSDVSVGQNQCPPAPIV